MAQGKYTLVKSSPLSVTTSGQALPAAQAEVSRPDFEHLMPYGKAAKAIFVKANGLWAYNRSRGS